jgi:succinate-semialdehyde dehydrogenase / glutarate-semialdehyde dehydrogenase
MRFSSVNPSTGELVQTFPDISDSDLERTISQAQRCYESDWSLRSIADRAKIVLAAATHLRANADEFAGYATLEMGKLTASALSEVRISAAILEYYANNAEAFLKPRPIEAVPGAVIKTCPIGVILGIEPWNFPYYQVARVVGPQVMAGNVVVIKHAENVPQCALAFARAFAAAGAPEGVYSNIFASIEQINHVVDDPRVRGVTVTGSARAGSAVAERAGRNLKKAVMELGGSDPFIVLDDAPLESAIESATFGRLVNAGQSCIASKRIIVVGAERGERFLAGFIKHMAEYKVGAANEPDTKLGPLSSQRSLDLLLEQIAAAKKGGATVALGGKQINRPGFYLESTVLTNIRKENPVFTQELFGPVACFFVVNTEEEAINLANASPFGLSGSIYTADPERGRRIADRIDSGMVFVNQVTWSAPALPFGGVKDSGFGRELSDLGMYEFVNRKLIAVVPPNSPPWGPVKH